MTTPDLLTPAIQGAMLCAAFLATLCSPWGIPKAGAFVTRRAVRGADPAPVPAHRASGRGMAAAAPSRPDADTESGLPASRADGE